MKNLMFVACVITLILTGSVGCSKKPNGWYPIEGGYINLKNVKTITTCAQIMDAINPLWCPIIINGPITRANVEKAKDVIQEKHKKDINIKGLRATAYIEFDGFKVMLDSLPEFESYKDIINLLDSWLESVEELELPAN